MKSLLITALTIFLGSTPLQCAQNKKPLTVTSKVKHVVAGMSKFGLAAGCIVPPVLLSAICADVLEDNSDRPSVPADADRNVRIKVFLLTKGFYFSIAAGIASWAYVMYKIGRSGANSFKTAVSNPEDEIEDEEISR